VAVNMFPGQTHQNDARDIHELHQIVLAARSHEFDLFQPVLTQFTAELPAVRTLLQQASAQLPLTYADSFLGSGAGDVRLEWLPGVDGVKLDFQSNPRRSGGLVAPSYTATGISRTLGPVPSNMPIDKALEGATLLGLPLVNLVKRGSLKAPTIVPLAGDP